MFGLTILPRMKISNSSVHNLYKLLIVSKCNYSKSFMSTIQCGIFDKRSSTSFNVMRSYCALNKLDSKQTVYNLLLNYGFIKSDINKMMKKYPNIFEVHPDNLITNLDSWLLCEFSENSLTSLILEHPNLLCVNPKRIEKLHSFLASKFTKSYIHKIFFNSPELLMDNIETVKEKISYFENEMLISMAEIVNSSALGHSLHHIRERHEFLRRVGIFKKTDKKNIDHINPTLDLIISSSDEDFATEVAGVSLEEYEVFQQLFLKEQED